MHGQKPESNHVVFPCGAVLVRHSLSSWCCQCVVAERAAENHSLPTVGSLFFHFPHLGVNDLDHTGEARLGGTVAANVLEHAPLKHTSEYEREGALR